MADAAPVVAVVAPNEVVTSATFIVTGKITDDAEFTADWKLGSGPATPITVGASGAFSVTIDAPVLDFETVKLVVTARDAHHEISVEKQLVIDRVAPTLTVTMLAANSVQLSRFMDLAVTTTSNTAEVTVSVGGLTAQLAGGPTSWTLTNLMLPGGDAVPVVLQLTARDAAGNTASIEHPIVVDTVAPEVTITAPTNASLHRTDIAVSATTVGAVSVTATFEGVTVPLTGGPLTWVGTIAVPQHDYAEGNLRVTALDASGNGSVNVVTIATDTVAPVITFTAPTAAQKFKASDFTGSPNVTNTWTVVDADPLAGTTVNGVASTALMISVPTNSPTTRLRT